MVIFMLFNDDKKMFLLVFFQNDGWRSLKMAPKKIRVFLDFNLLKKVTHKSSLDHDDYDAYL